MDINTLRALSTLLLFVAFIGLCFWVFSSKRKAKFDEAANLPFAEDEKDRAHAKEVKQRGTRHE